MFSKIREHPISNFIGGILMLSSFGAVPENLRKIAESEIVQTAIVFWTEQGAHMNITEVLTGDSGRFLLLIAGFSIIALANGWHWSVLQRFGVTRKARNDDADVARFNWFKKLIYEDTENIHNVVRMVGAPRIEWDRIYDEPEDPRFFVSMDIWSSSFFTIVAGNDINGSIYIDLPGEGERIIGVTPELKKNDQGNPATLTLKRGNGHPLKLRQHITPSLLAKLRKYAGMKTSMYFNELNISIQAFDHEGNEVTLNGRPYLKMPTTEAEVTLPEFPHESAEKETHADFVSMNEAAQQVYTVVRSEKHWLQPIVESYHPSPGEILSRVATQIASFEAVNVTVYGKRPPSLQTERINRTDLSACEFTESATRLQCMFNRDLCFTDLAIKREDLKRLIVEINFDSGYLNE